MINTYLTIFYTDVIGLTASAVSLILLIARVWDAINDPMMGVIADKTHSRWGNSDPPHVRAAVPCHFNVLTFTVFPVQGGYESGCLSALLCRRRNGLYRCLHYLRQYCKPDCQGIARCV